MPVVLLDTCVLYPAHLRDTMLVLAQDECFEPRWSSQILEELRRNLIDEMTCHAKDRHVLAAAVECDALGVGVLHPDDFLIRGGVPRFGANIRDLIGK